MDPIKNPYSPGAGAPPTELVGRDPILKEADILLGRIKVRRPEKSLLLTGLRGVGKTVLLNEIQRRAEEIGYNTILIEAHEDKSLGPLLAPYLRSLLFKFDRSSGINEKVKRSLSILSSFVKAINLSYGDFNLGLNIESTRGEADSGDIEIDLPQLFVSIGEAALERGEAVAVLIDEVQYLKLKELGALIMAMHKLQQKQLPFLLVGAGLPILPGLAGESKSYAERLFNFPSIGALSKEDAFKAIQDPAKAVGEEFSQDALERIYELTQGYPFFLQMWGSVVWNTSLHSPFTLDMVNAATPIIIQELDNNFFRVRFDRLTPTEKQFLRVMAEMGPGPYKMGDLAHYFDQKASNLSPTRAKLIEKGMIFSPSYGHIAFTVPLFDQFMIRVMPELP